MDPSDMSIAQVSSGIPGLDEILRGGYIRGRMYLLSGEPGTGKTTIGLHCLKDGLDNDETVLFIHGEESSAEIIKNAAQFNIDITGAEFLDLGPDSAFFTENLSYDLVEPGAVEGERYTRAIHDAIKEIDPSRVVLDPITQLRYVERSEHQYRKRLLSFIRFLKERDITVLATETMHDTRSSDAETRSLSDGVIELTRTTDGRRIEVIKTRGLGQIHGDHGLEIRSNGIEVFPRVLPKPNDSEFNPTPLGSGVQALDELMNGGLERGTVTFISGPPGVGKTTTGALYQLQAAAGNTRSVIYLFEERLETFTHRCRSIGLPIDELRADGSLSINVIDPLTLSAEEFAHMVRHEVEHEGAEVVMIDGFGGYTSAIQGDYDDLKRDLHSLTRYLVNREVSVFITDSIHQITGIRSATSANLSPLADNIVFLSYVESQGSLRKVIGVLKKRAGGFEHSLREFEITEDGVHIGDPMSRYTGILHGTPQMQINSDAEGDPLL